MDMWGVVVAVCVQFVERGCVCRGVGLGGKASAVCHMNMDRVGVGVVCGVESDPVVGVDVGNVRAYAGGWWYRLFRVHVE